MKFNTRFDPPVVAGVTAAGGLTDQHQKDDCDLNKILKRYCVGGLPAAPACRFEDLTEAPKDLQEAFDKVQDAVEWFDSLPSDVRRRYGNDPREALRAAMSGDAEELVTLFPDLSQGAEAPTPEPPRKAAEGAPAPVVKSPEGTPAA